MSNADTMQGHYVPAFAAHIFRTNQLKEPSERINLKGIAIGNGLTDPGKKSCTGAAASNVVHDLNSVTCLTACALACAGTQYGSYAPYAEAKGLISTAASKGIQLVCAALPAVLQARQFSMVRSQLHDAAGDTDPVRLLCAAVVAILQGRHHDVQRWRAADMLLVSGSSFLEAAHVWSAACRTHSFPCAMTSSCFECVQGHVHVPGITVCPCGCAHRQCQHL